MKVLLVSPYHGRSSHAAWAQGYAAWSRHSISFLTLSDRAWAWRMRGGAVALAEALSAENCDCDLILATSMTDLSSFLGLIRRTPLAGKPVVLYMHENQLSYPVRKEGIRDRGLPWIQFTSMLAADAIWFNSEHNRSSWFAALPTFLSEFPDPHGADSLPGLMAKSRVMPVGLTLPDPVLPPPQDPPILLWNQRWDWDKNPEAFCDLVHKLTPRVDFRVVMLGQTPKREPPSLSDIKAHLGDRLLHAGWCPSEDYAQWLTRATLTVSTARHEFFGIAVLEAVANGAYPLLPQRLAYPELLSPEDFSDCFYADREELYVKALRALQDPVAIRQRRAGLQAAAYRYSWQRMAPFYDDALEAEAV